MTRGLSMVGVSDLTTDTHRWSVEKEELRWEGRSVSQSFHSHRMTHSRGMKSIALSGEYQVPNY